MSVTVSEVVVPIREHVAQRSHPQYLVGSFVKCWGLTNGRTWYNWAFESRDVAEQMAAKLSKEPHRLTRTFPDFVSGTTVFTG